ncbi:MAG: DUF5686 family protein, partial [Bacteroidota bacterium]
NKKKYLNSINSYRTGVYVKATEIIDNQKKKKQKKRPEAEAEVDGLANNTPGAVIPDAMSETEKANQELLASLNMVEMQMTLNYQYPKKYREERTAYKKSGTDAGLFIPLIGETDFNFYRNMVRLVGIAEAPLISPISSTAILSYKYRLLETRREGEGLVYKIKVIPRKTGNSTCSGIIYINDESWTINRLDFKLHKGGLKFFDAFRLKVDFTKVAENIWIPARQEFEYETKQGRFKTFRGNTLLRYADYQHNYQFPKKFFSNELVLTTREAYERDSSYWEALRPEPLKAEEAKVQYLRDSIKAVVNSKAYQDSITAAYNKITFLEVIWDGVGFRNNEKKTHLYVGSIPSLVNYSLFGGWRVNPYVAYSKRWESGRRGNMWSDVSYGFRNQDFRGSLGGWMRYDPHRLADVIFRVGRDLQSINPFDAYLNQLRFSNYIINEGLEFTHRIELVNGLNLSTAFFFNRRKSLSNFDAGSGLANWLDRFTPVVDEPIAFEPYEALITDFRLSYTFAQKYMTEPNNKVVLGSKFPTLTLRYKKGWQDVLSSDINFDYWELSLKHDVTFGALGNSKYTAKVGTFTNTKALNIVDLKRFRESDPILYSEPLNAFQSLDTSLSTTNYFFEVHYIHHFNGALVNNIPLIKKTNIRFVMGGGFLYVHESRLRHEELFGGIERVFKLGPRRRMRIGIYGVVANGNYRPPGTEYKISFDIIDTWKKNWDF